MGTRPQPSAISNLGQRLRQARRARGLTQEALAAPEFSKSYISALEHGHARPSLKALELLTGRLGQPMSDFLNATWPDETGVDFAALDQDVAYQVDCARRAIDTDRAAEAVAALDAAVAAYGSDLEQISLITRYRLYYARATAYVRLQLPARAEPDLETARQLAEQMPDGAETVERVRNGLGVVFYHQDRPRLALEQHKRCLHAIQIGVVQDPNLCLLIYSNLANDYWALHDFDQAIGIYKEALKLLDKVNNLDRQAAIYWGLSMAYKAKDDLQWARIYAAQALDLYKTAQNQSYVALMQVNLAELRIARREYEEAEALLMEARQYQEPRGDLVFLSAIEEHLATIALGRGDLGQAAAHAQESIRLVTAAIEATADPGDSRANIQRTHARALRVAGLVAERQGRRAETDDHFQQALAMAEASRAHEAVYEIQFTYAELLTARGSHEAAARSYRGLLQRRVRPLLW